MSKYLKKGPNEYISQTKTSSNEYANIFERLKASRKNIQNIWGQSLNKYSNILGGQKKLKNMENMHLKADILETCGHFKGACHADLPWMSFIYGQHVQGVQEPVKIVRAL